MIGLSKPQHCVSPWVMGMALFFLLSGCGGGKEEGVFVWSHRGSKPGMVANPRAIGADADSVYVIDRTGRVQVFSHEGAHQREWMLEKVDNGTPTALTLAADGTLWIADTHNARILHYDKQGTLLFQFGEYGEAPGQFVYPTDITFGDRGELFVTEYGKVDRVQVFTSDGHYQRSWGGFGTAEDQFNRPMAIAKGPNGLLYIADSVNHRIKVYNQEGELQRILGKEGKGPGEFLFPYDVITDTEGNLYVCEYGGHRVQKLTAEGIFVQEWGGAGSGPKVKVNDENPTLDVTKVWRSAGSEPGQLAEPWGIALNIPYLFVADTKNHRISRFEIQMVE